MNFQRNSWPCHLGVTRKYRSDSEGRCTGPSAYSRTAMIEAAGCVPVERESHNGTVWSAASAWFRSPWNARIWSFSHPRECFVSPEGILPERRFHFQQPQTAGMISPIEIVPLKQDRQRTCQSGAKRLKFFAAFAENEDEIAG